MNCIFAELGLTRRRHSFGCGCWTEEHLFGYYISSNLIISHLYFCIFEALSYILSVLQRALYFSIQFWLNHSIGLLGIIFGSVITRTGCTSILFSSDYIFLFHQRNCAFGYILFDQAALVFSEFIFNRMRPKKRKKEILIWQKQIFSGSFAG